MAFAFGEQRHQHVRAGHLVAAGRLHVDRGALHDALETGGRLRITRAVGRQPREILVQELRQIAAQLVQVHATGAQHSRSIGVVGKSKQKVLQRRIFVTTFTGERKRAVQRLFEIT